MDILGQLGSELPWIPSVSCCIRSVPASHSVLKSVVTLAVVILRAYSHVTLLLLNNGPNPNSKEAAISLRVIIIITVFYY